VTRGQDRLFEAEVTIVCLDLAGRPLRLPEATRAALEGNS
jgi:acyl-CoA thioesterase FadM